MSRIGIGSIRTEDGKEIEVNREWTVVRLSDGKYSVRFLDEERWILSAPPYPRGISALRSYTEEQIYETRVREFFAEIERMLNSGVDKTRAFPRTLLDGPLCQF
jgi:hypothetical protein